MWFITVMEKCELDDEFIVQFGKQKVVGYYKEYVDALQEIHGDYTNMWEGHYNYAIVENMMEGVPTYCKERQWFQYDSDNKGYFETLEPKYVKHICNFSFG